VRQPAPSLTDAAALNNAQHVATPLAFGLYTAIPHDWHCCCSVAFSQLRSMLLQAGGKVLDAPAVEITYGLERILMSLQGVKHFKDIR
jgi:hypothetical protein